MIIDYKLKRKEAKYNWTLIDQSLQLTSPMFISAEYIVLVKSQHFTYENIKEFGYEGFGILAMHLLVQSQDTTINISPGG